MVLVCKQLVERSDKKHVKLVRLGDIKKGLPLRAWSCREVSFGCIDHADLQAAAKFRNPFCEHFGAHRDFIARECLICHGECIGCLIRNMIDKQCLVGAQQLLRLIEIDAPGPNELLISRELRSEPGVESLEPSVQVGYLASQQF